VARHRQLATRLRRRISEKSAFHLWNTPRRSHARYSGVAGGGDYAAKAQKKVLLEQVNRDLAVLRWLVRMAKERKLLRGAERVNVP